MCKVEIVFVVPLVFFVGLLIYGIVEHKHENCREYATDNCAERLDVVNCHRAMLELCEGN